MSRWLAMVEEPATNTETPADTLQEPSKSTLLQVPAGCRLANSDTEAADQTNHRTAVLSSIERGNHRPGAIASDTSLGVTVTYQLIERLERARRISQAPDGRLLARSDHD